MSFLSLLFNRYRRFSSILLALRFCFPLLRYFLIILVLYYCSYKANLLIATLCANLNVARFSSTKSSTESSRVPNTESTHLHSKNCYILVRSVGSRSHWFYMFELRECTVLCARIVARVLVVIRLTNLFTLVAVGIAPSPSALSSSSRPFARALFLDSPLCTTRRNRNLLRALSDRRPKVINSMHSQCLLVARDCPVHCVVCTAVSVH